MKKKFIQILVLACFFILPAKAEILSIGLTGTAGMLDADGKETFNGGDTKKAQDLFIAYASGFVEAHTPVGIRIGLSYVPYGIDSDTTESIRINDNGTGDGDVSNKVSVSVEDLASLYLSYHLDAGFGEFFLKAGMMHGELKTEEKLGTGSSYSDEFLEGTFFGAGMDKDLGNGVFVRGEAVVTDFDDIKTTSKGSKNVNTITVSGLGGVNASLSVGKSF